MDGCLSVPQPRGLREVVGTKLEPFLRGFQECSFQFDVEDFVESHAFQFAIPCPDGSHPLIWTHFHQEYCALFDQQLNAILEDLDIERDELLEWMVALRGCADGMEDDAELPGSGGVRCGDFNDFLKALTSSEDYERFVWVMFKAVSDLRIKEMQDQLADASIDPATSNGLAAPSASPPTQDIDVCVPEGIEPGHVLIVDFLGNRYELVVPPGCFAGSVFRATVFLTAPPLPP